METCEACGSEVVFLENEWARFGDSYDEELVNNYQCVNQECLAIYQVRNRTSVTRIE